MLEKILRQCVDDVKAEIAKKRSENKSVYYARGRKGKAELQEERNLTQQEREKIVEVLMSQERVLTLLYDKTFPPRSQSHGFTGQLGGQMPMQRMMPSGSASTKVNLKSVDSMRQFNVFNYHGQYQEKEKFGSTGIPYDEDVEQLEREIEHVIRAGTS